MSHRAAIRKHYEPRLEACREHFDILDWADAAGQQARFEVLARRVDLRGKSLLDVGCGLGDLWAFLRARRLGVDYTGVDILERMVESAQIAYPRARFVTADVFSVNPFGGRRFDVTFCSGVFNLDLGNNRRFLRQALARLMELTGEVVVFNLLHERTPRRHDHCFYHDPKEVRRLVERLGCRAEVVDDYLPNDFTILCRLDRPRPAAPPAKPPRQLTNPNAKLAKPPRRPAKAPRKTLGRP